MRIGLAVAVVTALALAAATAAQVSGQGALNVAVDTDVTGNQARTVGSIQNCARINKGDKLVIDVVLPDPGISSNDGFQAYQFDLLYDAAVVNVTAEDKRFLMVQAQGSSNPPFSLSDPLPSSDGGFTSAAAELGGVGIEPNGVYEVGPGVIARLTLTGVAKGSTNLTLSNVIVVDAAKNPIPLGKVLSAAVAVDTSCTPPPSPTPVTEDGSPGPSQTPGATGTPGAGDTPQAAGTPGTPGASPGPGTPVEGGSPVTGDGDGSAATGEGGGLSTIAWAGIGAGIAAAVAAASAAGWYALRRRKAGPG